MTHLYPLWSKYFRKRPSIGTLSRRDDREVSRRGLSKKRYGFNYSSFLKLMHNLEAYWRSCTVIRGDRYGVPKSFHASLRYSKADL